MTTYLRKSCSFGLPRVPFVNCRQFMYLLFSYFPFGFVGRMWDLIVSVPDHCLSFYFPSQAKAVMMYRIVKSLVAIPATPHLQLFGVATRGHHYKYLVPYCRTTNYKELFFPSTIRLWNNLPEDLTSAASLEVFKSGISATFHPEVTNLLNDLKLLNFLKV